MILVCLSLFQHSLLDNSLFWPQPHTYVNVLFSIVLCLDHLPLSIRGPFGMDEILNKRSKYNIWVSIVLELEFPCDLLTCLSKSRCRFQFPNYGEYINIFYELFILCNYLKQLFSHSIWCLGVVCYRLLGPILYRVITRGLTHALCSNVS